MTWQGTKTWASGELMRSTDLNTYVSTNLDDLYDPPSSVVLTGSDRTTTSTSFTQVHTSFALSITISTEAAAVICLFAGSTTHDTGGGDIDFDIEVDGVRQSGETDGIFGCNHANTNQKETVSFPFRIDSLAAGAHTIKLVWKTSTGTATLVQGAQFSIQRIG